MMYINDSELKLTSEEIKLLTNSVVTLPKCVTKLSFHLK